MQIKTNVKLIKRLLLSICMLGGVAIAALKLLWYPQHLLAVTGQADAKQVVCLQCHGKPPLHPQRADYTGPKYSSPYGMAISPDGAYLYVAASTANQLLELDADTGKIRRQLDVPGYPTAVAISANGKKIAISSFETDQVLVVDVPSWQVTSHQDVGIEPAGVALSASGERLYAANNGNNTLTLVDLTSDQSAEYVETGNSPLAVALAKDDSIIAVTNMLTQFAPAQQLPVSELTIINAKNGRIIARSLLPSANLSEGVVISSDNTFALSAIVQFRNLLPITQVARGALMTSAIVITELTGEIHSTQLPLDEVNAFFADPAGIALSADDRLAFVAHGGANIVSVIDVAALRRVIKQTPAEQRQEMSHNLALSATYVKARIPTAKNPRALVLSPDGKRLFVGERLSDSIAVIDTKALRVVKRFNLGQASTLTAERRGEQVFHDASVTFQGQFACRSCHPGQKGDGLLWDFEIDGLGKNLLETRSLRGLKHTEPYKWNGKNPNLATQCGPRFARVLTRSDPFSADQLADLVAYLDAIPVPPKRRVQALRMHEDRGQTLFFRTTDNHGKAIQLHKQCSTCHLPPLYSNRMLTDVGTGGLFDTPHLVDLRSSAPYLHDGRAATLEEIWTVFSPDDTHGITNDLSKTELNELTLFLKTL